MIIGKLKETLEQFKMTKNLQRRIFTSLALITVLFFMYLSNFILGYFLIIVSVISLLEFLKINSIIFKIKKIKQFISNLFYIIYISFFCLTFLVFSFFEHLKILLFIILLTCVFSDIGGFVFGKLFKGKRLTKISPNKTIYGAVGSIFLAVIFLISATTFLTKNFDLLIVIVAIVTSISNQIGDLFFSFLKRKSSLKDTGKILPGHGGILDRIDGILLGVPVGFLTLVILY